MKASPYVFTSARLPALKAKQLAKSFPFLRLSVAQEATARALGYSSWYDCNKRGTDGRASLSDQEAGISTRALRYYHQAGVLVSLGITPVEADMWVRAWGLTGQPTLSPKQAMPCYYDWLRDIELIEAGKLSDEEVAEKWQSHYSKYPEIDRPLRVCRGVVLAPSGKYPHYAVDPAIQARIPIFLRGPACVYHYEDDEVLPLVIPDFPEPHDEVRLASRLNPVQHEWLYGTPHPDYPGHSLRELHTAAVRNPEAMVIISKRYMPDEEEGLCTDRFAVACLKGCDFADFLLAKGEVDPSKVVWHQNIPARSLFDCDFEFSNWLTGKTADVSLPIFTDAHRYEQCIPIYSYPFSDTPMSTDEYLHGGERICLLPLAQDYDDSDDDGDDEIEPSRPKGPTHEPSLMLG